MDRRRARALARASHSTLVDLHLHTTASDGRLTPGQLVDRAVRAGVTVMAVTDHDTTMAVSEVRGLAVERGVEAISGIEVTAVERGRDIHILGYFADPNDEVLGRFLALQRERRIARVRAIAERLAELGVPVDVRPLLAEAGRQTGRAIGRPQVARAMVEAGHVGDISEAFDRWLTHDAPAFIPREGASCEEVIAILHRAGALASLAHPGKTSIDESISSLRDVGLDALEVYHSDHDAELVARYARRARELGMLMTGGSDYHGDPSHGREPGAVALPFDEWHRLRAARPNA
ncbi:MAG: PHP domain-containing protein [Vicinamibacterales bacterium]